MRYMVKIFNLTCILQVTTLLALQGVLYGIGGCELSGIHVAISRF